MKNSNYIFAIFILSFMLFSCENDGGSSALDLRIGAITDMVKSPDHDGFINLNDLSASNDILIGFSLGIENGDVASADLIGFYETSNNTYGPITLETGITQFPADFILNQNDIINAFPELNSIDDLQLADKLILTGKLYLNDGSEINILNDDGSYNYGSDISSSSNFNVKTIYPVSCPSDLSGTYNVISNGDNTDGQPPAVDLPYTITLTDNGGGSYTISGIVYTDTPLKLQAISQMFVVHLLGIGQNPLVVQSN